MMDIINKIVVQDIDAKFEPSTRKLKHMMALDDEVEANWAKYIFDRILESVKRNNTIQTSHTFQNDVMFRLTINYLLESKMSTTDAR